MYDDLFSQAGLSLERLRSFLAVAEAGSISRAAQGDASRQAMFSRQIRELEVFFKTELTLRRGKSLVLSLEGRRLAALIRSQLRDLDDFRNAQMRIAQEFTIGAGASVIDWLILPLAANVRQMLNGASIQLVSRRSRDLVEQVREGNIDFAVVREDALTTKCMKIPLLRQKFYLVGSGKLVSRRSGLSLKDPTSLSGLPFAASLGNGKLDTDFRAALVNLWGSFRPAFECGSLLQIRSLVLQGDCIGLLPELGLAGINQKGILMEEFLPFKGYGRNLVLHWNGRQMQRRGVEQSQIHQIASMLKGAASGPRK